MHSLEVRCIISQNILVSVDPEDGYEDSHSFPYTSRTRVGFRTDWGDRKV